MSIINRVLRDLEERRAQAPEGQPLVMDIRTVIARRRRADPWIVVGAVIGITVTVLLALAYLRWATPEPKPSAPPAPVVHTPAADLGTGSAVPGDAAAPSALVNSQVVPVLAPAPQLASNGITAPTAPSPSVATSGLPAPGVAHESRREPSPDASILPPVTELSKTLSRPLTSKAIKPPRRHAKDLPPANTEVSSPVPMGKATELVASAPAQPAAASETSAPQNMPPIDSGVDKRMREMPAESRAELLFRDGVSALQLGRVADAQGHFEAAMKILPTHQSARQALIGLLLDLQRYDQAELRLVEALALDLKNARYAMVLARVQVERGDNVTALRTLQATAPFAGDDANYNGLMAAVLQRLDVHDQAVEHFQVALKGGPGNASWLIGNGISLRALGRTAEARDAFTRAQAAGTLAPELQTFIERQLRELAAHKG